MGTYLLKGLLTGLIFGVPAGAIGALAIQRALSRGFAAGFITGLGSSAADLCYAAAGVFGFTVVSDFLLAHQTVISVIGGAAILLLGGMTFQTEGRAVTDASGHARLPAYFASSFAVAIANPATILSFLLAFSVFGIAGDLTFAQGIGLILGILAGTGAWWGALSGGAACFRKRITGGIYRKLNRVLGVLMSLFGVWVIVRNFIAL